MPPAARTVAQRLAQRVAEWVQSAQGVHGLPARGWLSQASLLLRDALYPPFCVLCHQDAPRKSSPSTPPLCENCAADAHELRLPILHPLQAGTRRENPEFPALCLQCSRPFSGAPPLPSRCADCTQRNPAFAFALATHRTANVVRALLHQFKYGGQSFLALPLAHWLAEHLTDERLSSPRPDLLVPVPLHWWKQWRRGFNQAELLAFELQKLSQIPLQKALRRVRGTGSQTQLRREERLQNLHRAFQIRPRSGVAGRHVLLIDDVLTTGATLDACARELHRAGAASVRALAVARG
jgi:competence protein ComFC